MTKVTSNRLQHTDGLRPIILLDFFPAVAREVDDVGCPCGGLSVRIACLFCAVWIVGVGFANFGVLALFGCCRTLFLRIFVGKFSFLRLCGNAKKGALTGIMGNPLAQTPETDAKHYDSRSSRFWSLRSNTQPLFATAFHTLTNNGLRKHHRCSCLTS